jgi:hypothetical protein
MLVAMTVAKLMAVTLVVMAVLMLEGVRASAGISDAEKTIPAVVSEDEGGLDGNNGSEKDNVTI